MAAALYNQLTQSSDADSAGTYVGAEDAPKNDLIEKYFRTSDFFELMEENGMNIRSNKMKQVTHEIIEKFDAVVSMAEDPFIPDFLRDSEKVVWWNVENPQFATREVSEQTYRQIKSLVEELI
jgi:protein-tyrosine-phosphatase